MIDCKAAIFDMDGVLTKTARQHAKAWKQMFDEFLEKQKGDYKPFDIHKDYIYHLDGISRYEGVHNFLDSRNIELPQGSPEDEPGKDTICGLGNRKNEIFQKILKEDDIEIYKNNIKTLKEWRDKGIKTGVISSSKNCKTILKEAEIDDLFDVVIDGIYRDDHGLKGKPAPDTFLEAAKMLDVSPDECVVVEDADAGVRAGVAGGFNTTIGMQNVSKLSRLLENGADIVVECLDEIDIFNKEENVPSHLPHALENQDILQPFARSRGVLFLHYDRLLGQYEPLEKDIEQHIIQDIREIAQRIPLVLISKFNLKDIKNRFEETDITYVGSHGLDISYPGEKPWEHHEAGALVPVLDVLETRLHDEFVDDAETRVRRFRYHIEIEFVGQDTISFGKAKKIAEELTEHNAPLGLKQTGNYLFIEPKLDWDLGKAALMIADKFEARTPDHYAVFIGSEKEDEPAFDIDHENRIHVLIGKHGDMTKAQYRLNNANDLHLFLAYLVKTYCDNEKLQFEE